MIYSSYCLDILNKLNNFLFNKKKINKFLLLINKSAECVRRQLMRKQRLSTELDNDKERLELMQREIRALQLPLPPGGALRLQNEIQRLRSNCERMVLEVEEAGQYGKFPFLCFLNKNVLSVFFLLIKYFLCSTG